MERGFLVKQDIALLLDILNIELLDHLLNFFSKSHGRIISLEYLQKNYLDISNFFEKIKIIHPEKTENINLFLLKLQSISTEKKGERIEENKEKNDYGNIKIINSFSLATKKLGVGDFVSYYRSRFEDMKKIIQQRTGLENLTSISKISGLKQNVSIIAMVINKYTTKNKNMILEVEDNTGKINLLVLKEKKVFEEAKELVVDDIVGFKCSGSREILFVNDIIFPEIFVEKKKSERDISAAFISDLHIGSSKFLEQNFLKFINWLNLKEGDDFQKEIAKKIKYLFVVGDLIDGVGIYPNQGEELEIKDVKRQYEKVAELFDKIRKDITIIITPGNHDALRIIEPQPMLDERYANSLYNLKNIIFCSNPSMVNIEGFNILTYHGYSYDYYANNVESLRINNAYKKPELIISFLLRRRHLAPTHGSTLFFPTTEKDPLMIREIPDLFVSGHIHKSGIGYYNNLPIISCSCWQARTAFQGKVGHVPDLCKVPVFNFKDRSIKLMDFE